MRGFGLIGIVLALAIVGVLAKRQEPGAAPVPASGATSVDAGTERRAPGGRAQQDVQRALDAAAQARRPELEAP